jgi:hypothetical protein
MADTSSIGPQWPPRESSHGRVKGIDNRGVIRDLARLEDVLATLEGFAGGDQAPDRLSIRVLIDDGLLAAALGRLAPWGEAIVPLDHAAGPLAGCSILYLGSNGGLRASDSDDLARSLANIESAVRRERRPATSMLERVERQGFHLRIVGLDERLGDPALQAGVAQLYRRFGWSPDDTRQILANPDSLIAVACEANASGDGGDLEVVSAGIAEISQIELGDGAALRIAEFTEAATRQSHQGRGLYSAVCASLMLELARLSQAGQVRGGEIDVAFGESSGHDLGVLIAAIRLGRTFSRQVIAERGLPFKGYLPQHVPIAGAPRSTRYNDLFPTFISRSGLYAFAQDSAR